MHTMLAYSLQPAEPREIPKTDPLKSYLLIPYGTNQCGTHKESYGSSHILPYRHALRGTNCRSERIPAAKLTAVLTTSSTRVPSSPP
jgi:hypothetical protein